MLILLQLPKSLTMDGRSCNQRQISKPMDGSPTETVPMRDIFRYVEYRMLNTPLPLLTRDMTMEQKVHVLQKFWAEKGDVNEVNLCDG